MAKSNLSTCLLYAEKETLPLNPIRELSFERFPKAESMTHLSFKGKNSNSRYQFEKESNNSFFLENRILPSRIPHLSKQIWKEAYFKKSKPKVEFDFKIGFVFCFWFFDSILANQYIRFWKTVFKFCSKFLFLDSRLEICSKESESWP